MDIRKLLGKGRDKIVINSSGVYREVWNQARQSCARSNISCGEAGPLSYNESRGSPRSFPGNGRFLGVLQATNPRNRTWRARLYPYILDVCVVKSGSQKSMFIFSRKTERHPPVFACVWGWAATRIWANLGGKPGEPKPRRPQKCGRKLRERDEPRPVI